MHWRHLPAHVLTAVRVPLAGLIWLRPEDTHFFVGILIAGGVSDVLDGIAARALDRDNIGDPLHIGAWLDPVCDKIFTLSCVLAATVTRHPPLALVACLFVRELFQLPLVAVYLWSWRPQGRHVSLRSVPAGKLTTVGQFAALLLLVLGWPGFPVLAPVVAGLGLLSVVTFLRKHPAPRVK